MKLRVEIVTHEDGRIRSLALPSDIEIEAGALERVRIWAVGEDHPGHPLVDLPFRIGLGYWAYIPPRVEEDPE